MKIVDEVQAPPAPVKSDQLVPGKVYRYVMEMAQGARYLGCYLALDDGGAANLETGATVGPWTAAEYLWLEVPNAELHVS